MAKIKDIAQKAGLSNASVSRILRGDSSLSVKQETKEKVFEIAKELGYTPKKRKVHAARRTIGLVQWISSYQELEDPYYYALRVGVENYFIGKNIEIKRYYQENMKELFKDDYLDGLICLGKFSMQQVEDLHRSFNRLVFVDSNPDSSRYTCVVPNLREATKMAVEYLMSKGHHKIGFIGGKEFLGPTQIPYVDARERMFLDMAKGLNELDFDEKFFYADKFDGMTGYHSMKEALSHEDCPTAFFCSNDTIAMGALRAIGEYSKKEISIIGVNDNPTSKFFNPPLTTVRLDTKTMAELAGHQLMLMMNQDMLSPYKVVVAPSLVERSSVYKI